MNFDWDYIKIFLAVARSGQILAAAQKLQLDHATVSRRLNTLEAELQAKLFDRGPGGCTLTPSGDKLLLLAEAIEANVLQIETTLVGSGFSMTGTVRIGAADGFGTFFLAPNLHRLTTKNPGLVIQIVPLPHNFSVSKREVDILISLEPPADGRLICQKLIDYRMNLYMTEQYANFEMPIREITDFRHHTVVTSVREFFYPTSNFFTEISQHCLSRYECASVAAQLEAVLGGAGIGVLPPFVAARYPELKLVLPEVSIQRSYWITSHPDARDLRRIGEARRMIVDLVRQHRSLFSGPGGTKSFEHGEIFADLPVKGKAVAGHA